MIDLRAILFIARTDIRHMLKQRETLIWIFVMPALFMYFIGAVTGGSGGGMPGTTKTPIALVVEPAEECFLLGELIARLEEQDFRVDRAPYKAPLEKYRRRLTVPGSKAGHPSLAAAVRAGEETVLRFFRRGKGSGADLDQLKVQRAVYTVFADLVVLRREDQAIEAASFAALKAAPRNIRVRIEPAGRRKVIPSGYDQAIPGTMIMFTMMILLTGGAITLVNERRQGLLRRLASCPIRAGEIVAGKWLGKLLLGLVQIGFALLVSVLAFGMDWGPAWPTLALLLLSWAAFNASLGLLLGNLARTEGQMSGIGVLVTMSLAALGGCWWPIEVTADWMQALADCLPTGWAMDGMHRLVAFQDEGSAVLPHITGLLAATLALAWIAARRFRYE